MLENEIPPHGAGTSFLLRRVLGLTWTCWQLRKENSDLQRQVAELDKLLGEQVAAVADAEAKFRCLLRERTANDNTDA